MSPLDLRKVSMAMMMVMDVMVICGVVGVLLGGVLWSVGSPKSSVRSRASWRCLFVERKGRRSILQTREKQAEQ